MWRSRFGDFTHSCNFASASARSMTRLLSCGSGYELGCRDAATCGAGGPRPDGLGPRPRGLDRGFITVAQRAPALSPEGDGSKAPVESARPGFRAATHGRFPRIALATPPTGH